MNEQQPQGGRPIRINISSLFCLFLGIVFAGAAVLFIGAAIFDFLDNNISVASVLLLLGLIFAFISVTFFRRDNRSRENSEGLYVRESFESIPDFKYHPNPLDTNSVLQLDSKVCDICNRLARVTYNMFPFYTTEYPDGVSDIDVDVCLDCIKSGDVTRKYTGKFNNPDMSDQQIFNIEKRDELALRTPGLFLEHPLWLTHCDDYCAVITNVYNWQDLEEEGLAEELENDWVLYKGATISTIEEIKEVMHYEYEGETEYMGILFRCIHCGKHRLYIEAMVDADDDDEYDYGYDEDDEDDEYDEN